jgi:hypothetical protein
MPYKQVYTVATAAHSLAQWQWHLLCVVTVSLSAARTAHSCTTVALVYRTVRQRTVSVSSSTATMACTLS